MNKEQLTRQEFNLDSIRKGDILFFPCKVRDFSPYEVVISLDPPKHAYYPNINGYITRRDVLIGGEPVLSEIGEEKEGLVKAEVISANKGEVNVFINGNLSHSPPFRVPLNYLQEKGVKRLEPTRRGICGSRKRRARRKNTSP